MSADPTESLTITREEFDDNFDEELGDLLIRNKVPNVVRAELFRTGTKTIEELAAFTEDNVSLIFDSLKKFHKSISDPTVKNQMMISLTVSMRQAQSSHKNKTKNGKCIITNERVRVMLKNLADRNRIVNNDY